MLAKMIQDKKSKKVLVDTMRRLYNVDDTSHDRVRVPQCARCSVNVRQVEEVRI